MNAVRPVVLGNVTTPNNIWLGPMAGVTDLPFRLLCAEQGAGLVSTEMVSAKAITYRNQKTYELMAGCEEERPRALQLFGSEPEIFAQAIACMRDAGIVYDVLDLNMGCPMPKIVNNMEGSALMKTPERIEQIVRACVEAEASAGSCKGAHPVTVKLRSGWDAEHINVTECALAAQEGGAAAVTVHARTREQYYSGSADYQVIASVKKQLSIPVIGSGDVTDAGRAARMLNETGCDGIMIARAAQGNPFIFREVLSFLQTGQQDEAPADAEIRETILRHARMLARLKGEYTAVREMRKHLAWYTAGRKGSARLRARLSAVTDMETIEQMCLEIFDK